MPGCKAPTGLFKVQFSWDRVGRSQLDIKFSPSTHRTKLLLPPTQDSWGKRKHRVPRGLGRVKCVSRRSGLSRRTRERAVTQGSLEGSGDQRRAVPAGSWGFSNGRFLEPQSTPHPYLRLGTQELQTALLSPPQENNRGREKGHRIARVHIHSPIQPHLHQSLAPILPPRKLSPPSVPDHGAQPEAPSRIPPKCELCTPR